MNKFKTVSVSAMSALLDADGAMLLDCRRLNDYQAAHIDNALHVHDGLVESLIKKADKAKPLLIYCYHGHASEHLAELFANFGFQNVYSVEGGYERWKKVQTSA